MFSDTCADQIAVFNYFQFNVRSSATIFITRTLVKLRQIFTAFAVSLSGQKIKFLIIISPAVCKSCFKIIPFNIIFLLFFSTDFFFHESFLTSCDSRAPHGKTNYEAYVYVYVLRSS